MGECGEPYALLSLVGTVQLVVSGVVLLWYPAVHAELYVYTPSMVNHTLSGAGVESSTSVSLVLPCLVTSVTIAAFTSVTARAVQSGTISESSQYSPEGVGEAGPWNVMFWFMLCITHAVVFAATTAPGDAFAFALCVCVCVHALRTICDMATAREGMQGYAAAMAANFGFMEYAVGMAVAIHQVPARYPNRYLVLFVLGAFDYFLCVGHTWDRAPTMQTIANCRLFYACGTGLALVALYGAWHDPLLLAH